VRAGASRTCNWRSGLLVLGGARPSLASCGTALCVSLHASCARSHQYKALLWRPVSSSIDDRHAHTPVTLRPPKRNGPDGAQAWNAEPPFNRLRAGRRAAAFLLSRGCERGRHRATCARSGRQAEVILAARPAAQRCCYRVPVALSRCSLRSGCVTPIGNPSLTENRGVERRERCDDARRPGRAGPSELAPLGAGPTPLNAFSPAPITVAVASAVANPTS